MFDTVFGLSVENFQHGISDVVCFIEVAGELGGNLPIKFSRVSGPGIACEYSTGSPP